MGRPSLASVVAVVMLLTACGPEAGCGATDLGEAVKADEPSAVRCLLEAGVDPEQPRSLGLTPLMQAANRDQGSMVRDLIDAGADLDATTGAGWAAIHIAARADAIDALAALREAGADPQERSSDGMSALDHAADAGSVGAVEYLIHAGLDPDRQSSFISQGHGYPRSEGLTPLALAVRAGRQDVVEILLDLGARVDAPAGSGHTPLLIAVFSGQPSDLVSLLLDAGADPTVRAACVQACSTGNADGLDALEWAQHLGRDDLIPLLQAAIAGN
jgi:ankyrin repeat protein